MHRIKNQVDTEIYTVYNIKNIICRAEKEFIMRYITDQDYHIHSYLSNCSCHPEQTKENILKYAVQNGFKEICITDHFWDESIPGANPWYSNQNFPHISEILPLPKSDDVRFYFGCETEMDKYFTIGLSDKVIDKLDFIIVPTTHLSMPDFTIDMCDDANKRRAELWVKRFEKLLQSDLPFEKVGIAHPTCGLIGGNVPETNVRHLDIIDLIDNKTLESLFTNTARVGMGVELNFRLTNYAEENTERFMRVFRIAKKCGCRFYFGSDAHNPEERMGVKENFEKIVDLLELSEDDKFKPFCG